MTSSRRMLLLGGAGFAAVSVGAATLAASGSTMVAGSAQAKNMHGLDAALELRIRQELAERAVEKCMNRYEGLLSSARVEEALQLFALSQPDVQADVGFGF